MIARQILLYGVHPGIIVPDIEFLRIPFQKAVHLFGNTDRGRRVRFPPLRHSFPVIGIMLQFIIIKNHRFRFYPDIHA